MKTLAKLLLISALTSSTVVTASDESLREDGVVDPSSRPVCGGAAAAAPAPGEVVAVVAAAPRTLFGYITVDPRIAPSVFAFLGSLDMSQAARTLIEEVRGKYGQITLIVADEEEARTGGCWDITRRKIKLSPTVLSQSLRKTLVVVAFELCNADNNFFSREVVEGTALACVTADEFAFWQEVIEFGATVLRCNRILDDWLEAVRSPDNTERVAAVVATSGVPDDLMKADFHPGFEREQPGTFADCWAASNQRLSGPSHADGYRSEWNRNIGSLRAVRAILAEVEAKGRLGEAHWKRLEDLHAKYERGEFPGGYLECYYARQAEEADYKRAVEVLQQQLLAEIEAENTRRFEAMKEEILAAAGITAAEVPSLMAAVAQA